MQKILLALTLTIALPVSGQQTADPDCDDPQTQAEMNACAYFGLQAADAELNRVWGSVRTRLKQAKEAIELECVSSSKVEFTSQLLK
jgi:uncharacterized protein YecT (DUF1311 family)